MLLRFWCGDNNLGALFRTSTANRVNHFAMALHLFIDRCIGFCASTSATAQVKLFARIVLLFYRIIAQNKYSIQCIYLNRGQNTILRKLTWRFHLCRRKTCIRVHNLYKLQKAFVQFHPLSKIRLLFCSYFRRKCPRPLHVFILFLFFFARPTDPPSGEGGR